MEYLYLIIGSILVIIIIFLLFCGRKRQGFTLLNRNEEQTPSFTYIYKDINNVLMIEEEYEKIFRKNLQENRITTSNLKQYNYYPLIIIYEDIECYNESNCKATIGICFEEHDNALHDVLNKLKQKDNKIKDKKLNPTSVFSYKIFGNSIHSKDSYKQSKEIYRVLKQVIKREEKIVGQIVYSSGRINVPILFYYHKDHPRVYVPFKEEEIQQYATLL